MVGVRLLTTISRVFQVYTVQLKNVKQLTILTTPTKNLRKRSNSNRSAENVKTSRVTCKTQTIEPKSKRARIQEKHMRNQETKRNPETKRPQSQETRRPRNHGNRTLEPWRHGVFQMIASLGTIFPVKITILVGNPAVSWPSVTAIQQRSKATTVVA